MSGMDVVVPPLAGSRPGQRTSAASVVAAAVWHGLRVVEPGPALDAALRLARDNQVQGALARVYPEALAEELARVVEGNAEFRQRLGEAVGRLRQRGVDPVLIKCDPAADFVYSNFDLVVGHDGWAPALAALDGWTRATSRHSLEPDKLIVHPAAGPAAHLHRHASWFGVVAIEAPRLRRRARRDEELGVLRPDPTDELRLLVAHAVFQNLAFDLAELLAIRHTLGEGADPQEARRRCAFDGWGRGFDTAFAVAQRAIEALDRHHPVALPVGLAPLPSLRDGATHAAHLALRGHGAMGLRELALRGPLVGAKLRRRAQARPPVRLLGVSGPDGSGKTTLVAALRGAAELEEATVTSLHPYGCVICRRWPVGNATAAPTGTATPAPAARRHGDALLTLALRVHPVVDAAELNLRLTGVRLWMRLNGIRRRDLPALVITDRSPLDALAKHRAAGPLVTDWFLGLARRYDRILLLDADPEELARRDNDHSTTELLGQRGRFHELGPAVAATRVDSSAPLSPEQVRTVVRDVTSSR